MARPASPLNTNSRDLDPLIKDSSTFAVKRAVVTRAVSGIDYVAGDIGVATHADDSAFGVATDPVVVMAGVADDTSPDSVDEGDAGALRMSKARALHVTDVADSASVTAVNSAATNTTLVAANADRIGLIIHNTDANALYVKYGATATTSSYTVKIPTDGYWEMPKPIYRGIVDGIWAADGSGAAQITELS